MANGRAGLPSGVAMLQSVEIFADVPAPTIAQIEASSTVLEPRNGSLVFGQGDPPDALYAILAGDGFVRIAAANSASKVLMVEVFRRGDVFGEIGVLDGETRTAQAQVDGQVRLLRIPRGALLDAMDRTPSLGLAMARLLCRRLRRTFGLFEAASFESLEVRLAQQLLYLAAVSGRRSPVGIRLAGRLRQSDLADLLGATPRSIITILNDWRARSIVAYDAARGIVTLQDEVALRTIARRDDD